MPGSGLILVDADDIDSGNDGDGSGSGTGAPGAVVSIPESADLAVTMFLGEAAADPASTTETLALIVQVSVDGGSTWGPIATFRTITASELNVSGTAIDESTGDPTFRRAIKIRTPRADSGQNGLVQLRTNTVISTTTNWKVFVDVRDTGSVRDGWYDDAQVA